MGATWLAGFEDHAQDAGEICVVEVFGRSVDPGRSAEIGMGVKAVNDPRLTDDFAAPRLDLDVTDYHTYAVEWDASAARFEMVRPTPGWARRAATTPFLFLSGSTGSIHGSRHRNQMERRPTEQRRVGQPKRSGPPRLDPASGMRGWYAPGPRSDLAYHQHGLVAPGHTPPLGYVSS